MTQHSVLLISNDVIGRKMAGPGIRYYHMARVLAPHAKLTLAIPSGPEDADYLQAQLPDLAAVVGYQVGEWATLLDRANSAEIIIFPSDLAWQFPQLASLDAALVIDGYDPLMIEWLEMSARTGQSGAEQQANWRVRFAQLHAQYAIGDFFICASERQRDWWLGLLEAAGRVNPLTHQADDSLRSLIDVAAYGVPSFALPTSPKPVIKGVWDGIGADDQLILWGGGLWTWLDPLTAIRAVAKLAPAHPTIRLIFPGTRHPNPKMAGIPTHTERAKALSAELGLTDKHVFFGDWVDYADWPLLLKECDIALSLHFDTLETRLAFRSRILEYVWADLPIVATQGDATSLLVAQYGLGQVVGYEDTDAVAQAIAAQLGDMPAAQVAGFAEARQALSWETVLQPLIRFCTQPQRAADRPSDFAQHTPRFPIRDTLVHERIAELEALVSAYENGRFIRLMKRVQQLRNGQNA